MPVLRQPIGTVLLIGAHSDDIEIGAGGTIRRLLEANPNLHVRWLVLSGAGPRADEARAAAAHFLRGANEPQVEVADFPDTDFPYAAPLEIRDRLRAVARETAPDLVFTHRREDLHQDHAFVAAATWQCFRDHTILEYEIPKYEGDLGHPNVFVPLSREEADAKVDGLMASFASQRGKGWYDAETFRALLRLRGVECQSPSGYAEAFHSRKMRLL